MAATNPNASQPLAGQGAIDASNPLSQLVRGIGGSQGFQPGIRAHAFAAKLGIAPEPVAPEQDFAGLGELLEASDAVAFKATHELVERQEPLARSRLAQDRHWKAIKLGYTTSELEKVQDQNAYRQAFARGSENLRISAVPNKAADLCNKLVEILNTDPPAPSPQATDDSEEAERATELAAQFLKQDGGEQGTDDDALFYAQADLATTSASAYLHLWTDKTGGGWVPSQIKAHPQAEDANNPLVGPNGEPTTDYILRYVTDADEMGQVQFTENPSEAGRTWLPKICAEKWAREHIRMFPEDKDLNQCQTVVGLFYCTLGEAKRRWADTVGQLDESDLAELCDWTPPRYMVLLPPALRSRWKQQSGATHDPKGSSNDERVLFYYAHYKLPTPDYPEGMALFTNGAMGGYTLEKGKLSCTVDVPSEDQQDQTVRETHLMEIPVVAVRLLQDPEEGDPSGKAFMGRIGGGSEAQARLAISYLEAMDQVLNPPWFATATSPVERWQVEESRGSGDFVPVLSKDDFPQQGEAPAIPGSFFQMMEWQTEQVNSIAGLPKPLQGADGQQEVSGVARRIAVGQANISMSRMQAAMVAARKRFWRLKLQQAMKHFGVPQLLKFVGEDGAYKQEWFTGINFAQVTSVEMQAGTGTMMPPQEKVTYVSQMAQMQFMSAEEAGDAARPTFTTTLGVPADPQQQRIKRQVSSWLEGPPEGWMEQAQQQAQAAPVASTPVPGQPPAPAPPPPQGPPLWTPFKPLAPDDEPQVATIRLRRLRRLLGTVRFTSQPELWQKVALDEYSRMRKSVADAAGSAAKAEQDKLIAVEEAKAKSALQIAQQESQVALQAQQAEAALDEKIEQAKLQMSAQAEQQKIALTQQADEAKLEIERQSEQIKVEAELRLAEMEQSFELQKMELEQAFELRKIELEASLKLEAQDAAAEDAKEVAQVTRTEDKDSPNGSE